jgi:hypothetical protein
MNERQAAIDRLLGWGNEIAGGVRAREYRESIAADLRILGVTDCEMNAAVRAGIRRRRAEERRASSTDPDPGAAP